MSLNWSSALGSIGAGMAHGVATIKKEQTDKEQLDYDRNRQAESDRQNLETHNQRVEQNKFILQDSAKKAAEIQRRDNLGKVIGQYQQYQQTGDIVGALKTYTDNGNSDNLGNPNWDQNHKLSFSKGNDNTYSLDVVDKNTGALIQTAKSGITFDDMIANTYSQIDPLGGYENAVSNRAKIAEETRKNTFEIKKLGTQHGYDIDKQNNQGNIDVQKEGYKHDNDVELEGIRQNGAYGRVELQQNGETNRANIKNGTQAITPLSLAALTVNAESGAQHYGKDGGLLRSYDPTSSARGAGQFTTGTRNLVLKASGIDAYKSPEDALQATAWYQQYNQSKLGGDPKAGFIAHYAGAGEVQKWMTKAKEQGISWESNIPNKYQERARLYDQNFGGSSLENQAPQQTTQQSTQKSATSMAQAASNQINSVSSSMTAELGLEGKKSAAVIGGLAGVQTQVANFASKKTYSERANAYNTIFDMVKRVIESTETGAMMNPQAKAEYAHQKSAELVGASNKVEVGLWIRNGSRGGNQGTQQSSTRNAPQFDFSDISVSDVTTNQPKPKAETKPNKEQSKVQPKAVANPLYSSGVTNVLDEGKKAFIPLRNTANIPKKEQSAPAPNAYTSNMNKYTNNPFS